MEVDGCKVDFFLFHLIFFKKQKVIGNHFMLENAAKGITGFGVSR